MASLIMNVVKEEAAVSATSVTSVASTVASASRTTLSHSIATCAPSARAAASHAGAESATLLANTSRQEAFQAVHRQPILGNLSKTAAEGSMLSSILSNGANSESIALRNALPELREQISNAVQQGFEEAIGDNIPQLEPTVGIAETAKQLEEIAARQ
ncbi:hypothetical protein RhiJN_02064 [Ceratobasidium sp. AG-Ba]|nr:hypothetical protein RhiJN_02064 [Ceratobasidium sp. AG-Ba]QRW02996.1 hypothetical protein RhiLY_01995 [Ceratobasidium sp. AG-Ba]